MLSALCHDVGHTGRTNNFEASSYSTLALRYNDESVKIFLIKFYLIFINFIKILENHHCALSFKILVDPRYRILA